MKPLWTLTSKSLGISAREKKRGVLNLCAKAEENPESKPPGWKQGWLTAWPPLSSSLAHWLRRPVREVEQWDQTPDKPCWLFPPWSEKHVKIIHPHVLGLQIVGSVDPFIRNMQPLFSAHPGERSNDQKRFMVETREV